MGNEQGPRSAYGRVWPAFAAVIAIALFPSIELLAAHRAEVDVIRLGLWSATLAAGASGIVWIAHTRDAAHRAAVLTALVLYLAFQAPEIAALQDMLGLTDRSYVLGWMIVSLSAVTLAIPLSRLRAVQIFSSLMSVGLLIGSAIPLMAAPGQTTLHGSEHSGASQPGATPNIWLVIPDGYSRADVVEGRTGLDLAPWIAALEQRGFQVADDARANYPTTWASVATMLDMDYVLDEDDRVGNRRPLFDRIRGNNATVRTLRAWGYGYVHSGGVAWEGSRCAGYEDRCLGMTRFTETDWALVRSTPLAPLFQRMMFAEVADLSDPQTVVHDVMTDEPEEPYFVLAHLLSPHPPFVRDARCGRRQDVPTYEKGRPAEYRGMVECLNKQLLDAIDTILEADPEAVIIIQSDHGHDWGVDFSDPYDPAWSREAGWDRWPLLSALRLPDGCAVPEDLSPVNTMRLVLACLSDNRPDLLPYRAWITTYHPDIIPVPVTSSAS